MPARIEVTQADLTEALTSFRLAVRVGRGQESREIADPETVASVLHATLSRMAAERAPDVVGDLAAELDQIKADHEAANASDPVTRLFAAVKALTDGHEPMPVYAPALNRDGSSACGHDEDDSRHVESDDGETLCTGNPGQPVCALCVDTLIDPDEAEWPCGPYSIALRELTGKGGTDG